MRGRAPCTLCALDPFANTLILCFYSFAHSSFLVQPDLQLCSLQLGLAHRWRTPPESASGAPTRQCTLSIEFLGTLTCHLCNIITLFTLWTVPLDIICSTLTLFCLPVQHSPHSPPACSRQSNCCRRHKSVGVLTLSSASTTNLSQRQQNAK